MPHRTLLQRALRKARGYAAKARRLWRSVHVDRAHPDDTWAAAQLTPGEARVYAAMDPRDREHACRVTRSLLRDHPRAAPEVVAAALLHDCGKSLRPYHVAERVLVGLIPNRLARVLPPIGAIGIRAHHPELGARLLAHAGARPRVARLVARHHHPNGDPDALLLHEYDDRE
ncbi:putative nucleotidyltransferase with HDIG domain [Deinococcus metalli]|uniref:Phosphohydrolase n=1 Tax=Deinococcus metalli TaxID=1141878 RepID=A0A7W8NSD8_9DEIO|nr:HD domain-containing protein [Deinococcus metalli]MBB5377868.1 putative nucleotidyltransferase with HDIG domain [Deinococcus metalli]GHF55378.1 phosphohydrolase [Deinococcus metalli]